MISIQSYPSQHHLLTGTPFDKGNLVCGMSASPNLKPTYRSLLSHTSWSSISYPPTHTQTPTHAHTHTHTHTPFTLQTSGIPNHVVWATNSQFTKPRACIFEPRAVNVPNQVLTLNQSMATSFHKRIP